MERGETTLIFDCDGFPEGVRRVEIPFSEVADRLRIVRDILGRELTMRDARDVVVNMVNQMRREGKPLPERFDFAIYIGRDLEEAET